MNDTPQILIRKINHATLYIESDMDIAMELAEKFKFLMDGYKFAPSYKRGQWDGYIRLFNLGSRTIASGLFSEVVEFCISREYTYGVVDDFTHTGYENPMYKTPGVTMESIKEFMDDLNLHAHGEKLVIREYQVRGVFIALSERQAILKASVGAGKSAILYCVCRYLVEVLGMRVLLIVPTIGLTTQMRGDFKDYSSHNGWDVDSNVHLISAGADHNVNKPIVISTFQSLAKSSREWINDFGGIISDEGHSITAQSFQNIYGKATDVPFRLACTGTLHKIKCNVLVMSGLTGPVFSIAETKDLIDAGQLVPMKIKAITLKYSPEICKLFKKVSYEDELNWIVSNPKRNRFIAKLAASCKGTTLIYFRFSDHGKALYDAIKSIVGDDKPVYLIDGDVSNDDREDIRQMANKEESYIVCSYGTMKAGVNLPAIRNIIIGHPVKGGITYLQSLGRGIRLYPGKTFCDLFDIGDNLSNKSKVNHTYGHFGDRMVALTNEGYEFTSVIVEF